MKEAPNRFGQNSMDYIRSHYGVPAKRGMRVRYDNFPGEPNATITGARDGRLLIRLDETAKKRRRPGAFHPTWNIHYPTPDQP